MSWLLLSMLEHSSQWDELSLEVADLHFKVAFPATVISSSLPPRLTPFLIG